MAENILEHTAKIDYCYWALGQLKEKQKPRTMIEKMIDVSTGWDEVQSQELRDQIIPLVEQVIESKKEIGADSSGDEAFLEELTGERT